jgi:hypothetical protein
VTRERPENPFNPSHQPLRFTEAQRQALSTRLMVQKPPDAVAQETFAELMRMRQTIENIPVDVLFTLEAIRTLAEQGNEVAKRLYWKERERLGIDVPRRFGL